MLDHAFAARPARDLTEQEEGDDDIVELARDGHKVGDEVDRHREVGHAQAKQQLRAAWDERIAQKTSEQQRGVRSEKGEFARREPTPGDDKDQHDEQPETDTDEDDRNETVQLDPWATPGSSR